MGNVTRIRKQDYDLGLADLMQFPVWEYALDEEGNEGQDERTVRPYQGPLPPDISGTYFIVRASFHLVDGIEMKGYITPQKLDNSGMMSTVIPYDLDPIIVTERGRVHFCYGASKPGPKIIAQNCRMLNRKAAQVFPIRFASDVEVLGGITEGTLEGFLYFDESVQDFFHLSPTDMRVAKFSLRRGRAPSNQR
jgi:hypothetical protein